MALALLVAGAAAGPIRPVAEPTQKGDTQYVFVKLLFEGAVAQLLAPGSIRQCGVGWRAKGREQLVNVAALQAQPTHNPCNMQLHT